MYGYIMIYIWPYLFCSLTREQLHDICHLAKALICEHSLAKSTLLVESKFAIQITSKFELRAFDCKIHSTSRVETNIQFSNRN